MRFLDFIIHDGNVSTVDMIIMRTIQDKDSLSVNFAAAHTFVCSRRDSSLKTILDKGLLIEDGKPLEMYLRLRNRSFRRVRAADYMRHLLNVDDERNRHFFLGGNRLDLEKLIEVISRSYPHLRISGKYSPPFSEDIKELVDRSYEEIAKTNANIVWIGLGAPKQFFVADALANKMPGVFLSVGAGFDYLSGAQVEAPELVQKIGLEWLFRLIKTPRRLFRRYSVDNLIFIALILKDLVVPKRKKKLGNF